MSRNFISKHSMTKIMEMKDNSRADAPEAPSLGPDFWEQAKIVHPEPKKSVHLRIDADVLDFFKKQGKGHLTRMNAVLRSYVEAQRGK